jgi:hypothetical protein
MDLDKVKEFLQDGAKPKEPSPQDHHVLKGYKESTLVSYNAAVRKFIKSMKAKGKPRFNLWQRTIYTAFATGPEGKKIDQPNKTWPPKR